MCTQAVNTQAISTDSKGDSAVPPQAEHADVQAASVCPLAVSTNSQGVSTSSPQADSSQAIQAGSSQAINNGTNSQGDRTIPPQAGSCQAEGADAQAVSTSPQAVSKSALTPRVLVLLLQAAQPSSQENNANRSPNDNSLEDPNPKWVINLSSKPLTQAQRSVLAKCPDFAVTLGIFLT